MTSSVEQLTARIDQLESQLAFQEDIIESLNQLVTQQADAVYKLQNQVKLLATKHQQFQAQQNEGADPSAHEPPPHY